MDFQPADNFFARRWRGQVPMRRLLWHDTLLVASFINLGTSVLALAVLALDGPALAALAVHLIPQPYNFFLLLAVTRAPDRSTLTELLAMLWFVVVLLV
ncbi:hypothetical protein [Aquimonas sp.]|jgi:hypothetical protein|uniref:hypothetical protein n=1 Tax=Aquimonas sp. TaxID=1872588 RepID=UPI0037BEA6A2